MTYVRWFWPDEDLWCYDELDDDRWPVRHIAVRVQEQAFAAATSLAEVIEARHSGVVNAYERRYGLVPEAALPLAAAADPPIETIAAEEFERLWHQGRQAREQQHGRSAP